MLGLFLALAALAIIGKKRGFIKGSPRFFGMSLEPAGPAKGGATKAAPGARPYRKILYVKVTCREDRDRAAAPVYHRTVEHLKETERVVPVFDEAVYYTLELMPSFEPARKQ